MYANCGNRSYSNASGYSDQTRGIALRNIERKELKTSKPQKTPKVWTYGDPTGWDKLNKVWH